MRGAPGGRADAGVCARRMLPEEQRDPVDESDEAFETRFWYDKTRFSVQRAVLGLLGCVGSVQARRTIGFFAGDVS